MPPTEKPPHPQHYAPGVGRSGGGSFGQAVDKNQSRPARAGRPQRGWLEWTRTAVEGAGGRSEMKTVAARWRSIRHEVIRRSIVGAVAVKFGVLRSGELRYLGGGGRGQSVTQPR